MEEDDGFVTIGSRGLERRHAVAFYASTCRVPFEVERGSHLRADWQWNQNGALRLRLGERGRYRVNRDGKSITAPTAKLYTTIGRSLAGQRLPIERIDGNDIYLRIGEEGDA